MKLLVIPDIHNKVQKAEHIMKTVAHDQVVFLGDFFDAFYDGYFDAIKTGTWLANMLDDNPTAIPLFGNHDLSYRFPGTRCSNCSGFTSDKCKAIELTVAKRHWDRFKCFYRAEGNWLLSHAGIDKHLVPEHIMNDPAHLESAFNAALQVVQEMGGHQYFESGHDRGGDQKIGGITWIDFETINPAPEIRQLVGHTPVKKPRIKFRHGKHKFLEFEDFVPETIIPEKDCIVNIDTHLNHYAIIEDGKLSVHKIDWIGTRL